MKRVIIIISAMLLAACGGGNKNNNPTPTPPSPPTAASLSAPAQNQVCTTGTIISTTQSSIAFTWTAGSNTNSYTLIVKNLLTKDSTSTTTTLPTATLTLLRGVPYSWYVVSSSTQTTTTAKSDIWKFYNSGAGTISYPPYPATITAPTFAQSVTATGGKVNLTWTGSIAPPSTIAGYDVYFGTTTTPAKVATNITDMFLNNQSVTSGTTYYWKVITKNQNGDTSDSGLYQFKVN